MKYILLLCDGMSDHKQPQFGGKTPMSAADKPNMDYLARHGRVGLVRTVPDGMKPGSDVANLAALGYDPKLCYSGRAPLEAASIGIALQPDDIAIRCNLVTLDGTGDYERLTMRDYCAGGISTQEAGVLVDYLQQNLGGDCFDFHVGKSYRHCLIWNTDRNDLGILTEPHNILDMPIAEYLPDCDEINELMRKSYEILKDHPVNIGRIERGLAPANSIWLWGGGRQKQLMSFREKYQMDGAMISAVDLLNGIAILTGMEVIRVEGATGYIDTNFEGKAAAALDALHGGKDFVYLHLEAPDECGHRAEYQKKLRSIEMIDKIVLSRLLDGLDGTDYRILIMPDHATPLELRTHTDEPVPYLIYSSSDKEDSGVDCFDEDSALASGVYQENAAVMIRKMIEWEN
ncbi:MAG: cofactor-independent phosphoglycerate mutase [Oscillospiraceae bacterium]|nr:cofactor-independent phosphoglycerate mutase [Oscillospiraceae bacterium]